MNVVTTLIVSCQHYCMPPGRRHAGLRVGSGIHRRIPAAVADAAHPPPRHHHRQSHQVLHLSH